MAQRSIAVILSAGGAILDLQALGDIPRAKVVKAQFALGERAGCAAATLEHDCHTGELLPDLKRWAGARGWSVTIAPLPGHE